MSRIEELEKRLAADPNSRMFVQLAEEYRKAGLLEQAIEVCEEGIKKHPQYPSARVALGRALLEAEAFDRASAEFETVLKTVPDNILANKFLGETYHRLGRLEESVKKYQVAQTLSPEDLELGDRIAAVQRELAGGPPTPAAAAPEEPAAPPPTPPPLRAAPPPPPSSGEGKPPIPPQAPTPVADVEAPTVIMEPMAIESHESLEDELPPIPLVDVDEPMVLEDRFSAPSPPAPSPPPPASEGPVLVEPESFIEPEPFFEPETPSDPETPAEPMLEALPEPVLAPAPGAPADAPSTPTQADLETRTMAELYASQGHLDQAIGVYEKLVGRRPEEPSYRERLGELRMLEQATRRSAQSAPSPPRTPPASSGSGDKTLEVLSGWLDAIKKSKDS